jgi:uncharacterized protein (TIGR03032 family)
MKKKNMPVTPAPTPFQCTYTPNIPELLQQLGCSLAISTYQAGKVIFLSPKDGESLIQLPRTFDKPMGIALHPTQPKMALACKGEVAVFSNSPALASGYPKSPNTYDSLYMPQATYKTGYLDIHDLEFGKDGLYAVNTLFSCVAQIDEEQHFSPYWQPNFVSDLVAEDRCHLNGMVMEKGLPRYVSCFNQGDSFQSWRKNITNGGIIIDVRSNEIVTSKLAMPHSPRLINNDLYVLLSATGELVQVDRNSGAQKTVLKLDGFVRGMTYYNDFLFIGLSKIRKNSSTFADLPISNISKHAGIKVVHLPTASVWGEIRYDSSVDEIYDVKVLNNQLRPNVLNPNDPIINLGITTPTKTFWAKMK